jgi:rRNA maturation endonuclease Nob1
MGREMLSFKEHMELNSEEVDEALDASQRMKAKATFRKNKAKIIAGRKRAEKKTANAETIAKRAKKAARKAVEKKLLKDKDKGELSYAQRQGLEKKLDAKKGAIDKLTKKLIPVMKKKERERKLSKSESN